MRSLLDNKGLSLATVSKDVSQVRGYWYFLVDKELVAGEEDPFRDVLARTKKQARGDSEEVRQPFTDEQLVRLLTGAADRGDSQLVHLIRLAMWTGCRIEELCALKLTEVSADRIKVIDAKTKARGSRGASPRRPSAPRDRPAQVEPGRLPPEPAHLQVW